jgi:hypothetical protein
LFVLNTADRVSNFDSKIGMLTPLTSHAKVPNALKLAE